MPNHIGMRDPYPSRKEEPLNREAELGRYLAGLPASDRLSAAHHFRAGWDRLARLQAPILRRWEDSWWRQAREIELLRARIGVLISRISRMEDRG